MIYKCVWNKTQLVSSLLNAHAQVYVLAISHCGKAIHCLEYVSAYAHAIAARIELVHLLLVCTAYATCGED